MRSSWWAHFPCRPRASFVEPLGRLQKVVRPLVGGLRTYPCGGIQLILATGLLRSEEWPCYDCLVSPCGDDQGARVASARPRGVEALGDIPEGKTRELLTILRGIELRRVDLLICPVGYGDALEVFTGLSETNPTNEVVAIVYHWVIQPLLHIEGAGVVRREC